jgi:peptidyl-prolyl cis-trans isomerase SurA
MKHIVPIVLLAALLPCSNGFSQTLFSYGNKTVSSEEFMRNFTRNNNNLTPAARETALKENLDLYIRYKLKVQAAYDMRYDTLMNQREELTNFRRQIENNYLDEKELFNKLVEEAFQRQQKDIRLLHIIIPFDKKVKPADTAAAYAKINEAYKKLKAGEDFAKVAKQYSADPDVAVNNGDLGYITVFSLPYEMENAAYKTPVGKFSAPFKSAVGYHIFKPVSERKALGKIKAAQVLLGYMPGASDAEKKVVAAKVRELYNQLKKGEPFENVARAHSSDYLSAQYGGVLPEFGVGKYEAAFENAVFGLVKDEDFSQPFETAFGWHIVKRISQVPVNGNREDAAAMQQLTELVRNNSRAEISKNAFAEQAVKKVGYKAALLDKQKLMGLTRTEISGVPTNDPNLNANTLLHTVGNQKVTVGNFWQYAKDVRSTGTPGSDDAEKLLKDYINATALEYYRNHLEEYNPAFKSQLMEFKDGNLLFEAMEKNVWNKAAQDSAGLVKYHAANSGKYIWEKSATAIIFSAADMTTARELSDKINANPKDWKNIMEPYLQSGKAQADSGRFELGNIPVAERTAFSNNLLTLPYSPNNDGTAVFAYIFKVFEPGDRRSFEEARGLVINDYQVFIEDKWIADLKKKYPVKMNESVWADILKKGK